MAEFTITWLNNVSEGLQDSQFAVGERKEGPIPGPICSRALGNCYFFANPDEAHKAIRGAL